MFCLFFNDTNLMVSWKLNFKSNNVHVDMLVYVVYVMYVN